MNQKGDITIFQELIELFDKGVRTNSSAMLSEFINDTRVSELKSEETRQEYIKLRLARAEACTLFGKFDQAFKEIRLALVYTEKANQWEVYLKWSHLAFLQFSYAQSERDQRLIAEAGIQIAKKGQDSVTTGDNLGYRRLSFASSIAFYYQYLGEEKKALEAFESFLFKPIPIPEYNNKQALTYLFANYAKALAVSIQQKNETLLRKQLRVISIDDQTLHGEKNVFALFHATLMNTIDMRKEFEAEFNSMFRLQGKLGENFTAFDYFLTSIKGNLQDALNAFFAEFK